jgi:hypothetical protein
MGESMRRAVAKMEDGIGIGRNHGEIKALRLMVERRPYDKPLSGLAHFPRDGRGGNGAAVISEIILDIVSILCYINANLVV